MTTEKSGLPYIAKWALGILGTLLTGAVVWLATETISHGTALAVQETKEAAVAEKLDRIEDGLKELDRKLDRLIDRSRRRRDDERNNNNPQ